MTVLFELIINLLMGLGEFLLFWQTEKTDNHHKLCACQQVSQFKQITDPKKLSQAIRALRKQLVVYSFREIKPHHHSEQDPIDFLKQPIEPPWPSQMQHQFECLECGKQHQFTASFQAHQNGADDLSATIKTHCDV